MELTELIIRYECGELVFSEVIQLFSDLIITGKIYHLQGSYQRDAQRYIDANVLMINGAINQRNLRMYINNQ